MKIYRAVLFDLDGLIVDTEPLHFRAFQDLVAERGFTLPESVMESFIGYDELSNLQDIKRDYSLAEDPAEMLKEKWRRYEAIIRQSAIEAMPGFWEAAEAARAQGMKRAVVTSSFRSQASVVLERVFAGRPEAGDFARFFDALVFADDVARTKPAPDLYLLGAERVGCRPEECLALEDSPAGVLAATEAGVDCLAVVGRYGKAADFKGALAVLSSLPESLRYLQNKT
jgi:HAD superfamily hydrolase (TIGR01509 family)